MVVVATAGAGAALWVGRAAPDQEAAEVDSAVLIDLPAKEASSQPASDAAEGPEQAAAQASQSQQAPEQIVPPKDPPKPIDEPKPPTPATPVDVPPPPVAPDPPAVIERKQEVAPPPKPVAAPATQAQDERAPTGAAMPARTDAVEGDEGRPRASAHAITSWQKSLVQRLERAKRLIDHEPHAAGMVKIAFTIDGRGALAAEWIAQTSGSATLDKAAVLLVKQAAPFPAPPPGTGDRDAFFVVPIRFR